MIKNDHTKFKNKNEVLSRYLNSNIRSSAVRFIDFICEVDYAYYEDTILKLVKNKSITLDKISSKRISITECWTLQNLKSIVNSMSTNLELHGISIESNKGKAAKNANNNHILVDGNLSCYDDRQHLTKYNIRVNVHDFIRSIVIRINNAHGDLDIVKDHFTVLLKEATLIRSLLTSKNLIMRNKDDAIINTNNDNLDYVIDTLVEGIFNDGFFKIIDVIGSYKNPSYMTNYMLNNLDVNSMYKSVLSSINMVLLASGVYSDVIYPNGILVSTTIMKDNNKPDEVLRGKPNPYYKIIPALDVMAISENIMDACKNTTRAFVGAISIVNQMRGLPSNYKNCYKYDIGINQLTNPSNYTYTLGKARSNNNKWGIGFFSYDLCKNNIHKSLSKNFNRFDDLITDVGRFVSVDDKVFDDANSKYLTCNVFINFPQVIDDMRSIKTLYPIKTEGIYDKYNLKLKVVSSRYSRYKDMLSLDDTMEEAIHDENSKDLLTDAISYAIKGCIPMIDSIITGNSVDLNVTLNTILVHMHLHKILLNSKANKSLDDLGCRIHGLLYLERLKENLSKKIEDNTDVINMVQSRLDTLTKKYHGLSFDTLEKFNVVSIINTLIDYYNKDGNSTDDLKEDILYVIIDFLINTTPSFILIPGGQGIFRILQKQLLDDIFDNCSSIQFSKKDSNKIIEAMIEESTIYTKSKFRHNTNRRYIEEQKLYNFTESVKFLEGFLASTLYVGLELGYYGIEGYKIKNV